MGKYDDIINLPHHVSDYHKQMPMANRAAQFAPFAALTGHNEAISETARMTEEFRELSDEEKKQLSVKLHYAIHNRPEIFIVYFEPDLIKRGGTYKQVRGRIKKWDELKNTILLTNGTQIPVSFISDIKI